MTKILLHVCCGPCTAYPLQRLREQGYDPEGFFYNPNIHPYAEFKRRLDALETLAGRMSFQTEVVSDYGLSEYLRQVVFREQERCSICYAMRLVHTARHAKECGADAFSTTLLYSRYQDHASIKAVGERLAVEFKIPFHYEDFRVGWDEGIAMAREMDLYRQPYCGCIYSEQERYDKRFRKKREKGS